MGLASKAAYAAVADAAAEDQFIRKAATIPGASDHSGAAPCLEQSLLESLRALMAAPEWASRTPEDIGAFVEAKGVVAVCKAMKRWRSEVDVQVRTVLRRGAPAAAGAMGGR